MFGRRRRDKSAEPDDAAEPDETGQDHADQTDTPEPADVDVSQDARSAPNRSDRSDGPWDSSERQLDDEYLDLGSMHLKGREGMSLQLPTDNGVVIAVVVVTEDSAMELRAFAASKSGGEWTTVSAEIADEITNAEGTWQYVDGPWGSELHAEVPAIDENGALGVQRSRMIGVEGPRWLLRATLFGAAAQPDASADYLLDVVRDLVIHRGPNPLIVGEQLPLTMPPGVEIPDAEQSDLD